MFAVQKLNEGWDVLNLFDIVRLYETRDGKGDKIGKTTLSVVYGLLAYKHQRPIHHELATTFWF